MKSRVVIEHTEYGTNFYTVQVWRWWCPFWKFKTSFMDRTDAINHAKFLINPEVVYASE